MEWAKVLSFVWEKVLFYREVKLLITFTETFFSSFKSYRLTSATVYEIFIYLFYLLLSLELTK